MSSHSSTPEPGLSKCASNIHAAAQTALNKRKDKDTDNRYVVLNIPNLTNDDRQSGYV